VAIGRIGKPHGVRGWVTVAATTDEPERRFAPGSTVMVDEQPRVIEESRLVPRVALRLENCSDREDAEALRGHWLYVDVAEESPADPDEFYDHQLEGLQVVVDGAQVGTIAQVLHLPGHDVLAVDTAAGQALVPFVADIVTAVDLGAGRVEVVPMEGLFDDAH